MVQRIKRMTVTESLAAPGKQLVIMVIHDTVTGEDTGVAFDEENPNDWTPDTYWGDKLVGDFADIDLPVTT